MASNKAPEVQTQPCTGDAVEQRPIDENTPLLSRDNGSGSGNAHPARRRRSHCIFALCGSVLLIDAIIAILALFGVYRVHGITSDGLCMTPACIHAASEFLYNLSPNYQKIDPCTDFDAYVCDGWRERRFIPPGRSLTSSFDDLGANIENIVRSILERGYPGASEHSYFFPGNTVSIDQQNFDEIQRAYNACMAFPEIQKVGAAPLEASLQDLAKTFYSLSSETNSSTWAETYLWLQRNDKSPLVSIMVDADDKSPDEQVIFVNPTTSPGLPSKRYYKDKSVMSAYQDAMVQVLAALKPTAKDAAKHAADIVQFEIKAAAISPEIEDIQDPVKSYNPMSLKDATSLVPQFGLDYVLKSLAPSNYTIDRVIVPLPSYFKNLSTIIDGTPNETLQKYFLWRLIVSRSSIIETPKVKPYIQFSSKLGSRDPHMTIERYKICIDHIDHILGWMLSRFVIETISSSKSKELGNQIVSDIKEAFIQGFHKLDWMDNSVKKLASEKVRKITQMIGYPSTSPNITDPKALRDYYAGLNISNIYYDNYVSSVKYKARKAWSKLGKPTDWNQWPGSALTLDATCNQVGNQMIFPAGIMQFPFFGGDLPGYVNYGAFGSMAGHELSHAFDPAGRMYDVNGSLSDWWTNHTSQEFDKRAQCFISEFGNFTVTGPDGKVLHLNGQQTVGENVADAGGISAAWLAWQKRKQTSPDKHLPGLASFTQEQLFYISYGNIWCTKYKPEALAQQVLTDPHSPGMFRSMGTAMMNSRGFRQAFNCAKKEPVCEIW